MPTRMHEKREDLTSGLTMFSVMSGEKKLL